MPRYIDAEKFEVIGGKVPESYDVDSYLAGCKEILEMIDSAPTVDAVEVIRCRNCEHWSALRNFFEIGNCTRSVNTCTPGSFYCADGRRKMDAEVER